MKKIATFLLFTFLCAAVCLPAGAQGWPTNQQQERAARKANKKQRRLGNKYAKQQQKAMRKSAKAQRKALKRARRRSLR